MTTTYPALAAFRYLITDMDGVLWRGSEPLPGLAEFFQFLRQHGIRFVCATNNASTLPEKLAERLQGWGAAIHPEEIVTSSSATADYLADTLPAGARLYVVGMEGLRVPLLQQGFEIAEDHVAAVVAGIDWHLTYDHLKRAALNIRAGAKFIGTNSDRTFPSSEGIIPGAGAILAAIETGTGVKPIVMGKPEPYLYEAALKRMQAAPAQTLVLGDRLETDILGAVRLNLKSVLVLSGVTTREQLAASDYQPDWVFDDITDLKKSLGHGLTPMNTDSSRSLYDLKFDEIQALLQEWGEPVFRAKQIWEWLYVQLAASYDAMTNLPRSLRDRLGAAHPLGRLTPGIDLLSSDGWTRKILFTLPDRAQIETVLMEYDTRNTVCVSTQAGCAMGCTFCATGQGGFQRNLTAGEIVEQVLFFERELRRANLQPLTSNHQ